MADVIWVILGFIGAFICGSAGYALGKSGRNFDVRIARFDALREAAEALTAHGEAFNIVIKMVRDAWHEAAINRDEPKRNRRVNQSGSVVMGDQCGGDINK